jgi:hypothetical protein
VGTDKDFELLKQKIRTTLETTSQGAQMDAQYIEWFSNSQAILASALKGMSQVPGNIEKFKSDISKETSEYDHERRRWIRYRQSRSKTVDDIVKRKDELARSIKEGKVDIDHVVSSAGEGDVRSLTTISPYWKFAFQKYELSWWERFINFVLRRKIDTNPP